MSDDNQIDIPALFTALFVLPGRHNPANHDMWWPFVTSFAKT